MHTSNTIPSEQEYALVVDNQVILFPLTEADIYARNQPNEDYYRCYRNIEPKYNHLCEYLEDVPVVVGGHVIVNYRVMPVPVEDLFAQLDVIRTEVGETFSIADVPSELLLAFSASVTLKVETAMNTFAKTRKYDTISSAADYRDSPIEKYRLEGIRARNLRDTSYYALEVYFYQIVTGQVPVPTSLEDIAVKLPEYTWDSPEYM